MTDRELLENCLAAFRTLTGNAADCRKFLKIEGFAPRAYAGPGQYLLARHMIMKISDHLDEKT